jgi:hypothetical protein
VPPLETGLSVGSVCPATASFFLDAMLIDRPRRRLLRNASAGGDA